jgi:repressor LexA
MSTSANRGYAVAETQLSGKRRQILEFIERQVRERGYPPSVREIGEAVGLTSSSTVHTHLQILQRHGFLRRDPTKPRAIVVSFEPSSGAAIGVRPVAHVPLVGNVAAGTGVLAEENVEEVLPVPEDLTGPGELFMLRVRGDSMIGAGIFDGDLVVVRSQQEVDPGDVVVAGIGEDEATVKTYRRRRNKVVLVPSNPEFDEIELAPDGVTIYGKVVTVLRALS